MQYLRSALLEATQREPIPGQVPNSAGGYSYPVDNWKRLDRFLVLGSEGGSYYATEKALTKENANAVVACIAEDGLRAVRRIVEISDTGRAPKNDPALFALALCASAENAQTRKAAFDALLKVARIGTHLLHFAEYLNGMRGWGRGARAGIGRWYTEQNADQLAYQFIKYRQRDGWTHRDILRLAHPQTSGVHNDLIHWAVKGWPDIGDAPHPDPFLRTIWAYERAQKATDVAEIVRLIIDYRLPREALPTQWLNERAVWEAMLPHMPLEATIRNLGKMSAVGLIAPLSAASRQIAERLGDRDAIIKARLHPIKVLSALLTYSQGHGTKGSLTWDVDCQIVDALDQAFYLAFHAVQPTNKRHLLALDVSGSMGGGSIAGVPGLTPRVGAAAMALITAVTEQHYHMLGFSHQLIPLTISPRQRLDDVVRATSNIPFGGTDCALPMLWAIENKAQIDAFVVYTDSETWAGNVQPVNALRQYRQQSGIAAKLIVVGMLANNFTIASPDDGGMLDVVGFDTAAPSVMADFIRE